MEIKRSYLYLVFGLHICVGIFFTISLPSFYVRVQLSVPVAVSLPLGAKLSQLGDGYIESEVNRILEMPVTFTKVKTSVCDMIQDVLVCDQRYIYRPRSLEELKNYDPTVISNRPGVARLYSYYLMEESCTSSLCYIRQVHSSLRSSSKSNVWIEMPAPLENLYLLYLIRILGIWLTIAAAFFVFRRFTVIVPEVD